MSVAVLISSDTEWGAVLPMFPLARVQTSPVGEWFDTKLQAPKRGPEAPVTPTGLLRELEYRVFFFHGGWGKIAAAASTQYVIDRWRPSLLINLGTCGGVRGAVERGEILLVTRTIVYDIAEQMNDPVAAVAHYITELDLSWLEAPYPQAVRPSLMLSGDRDLAPADLPGLTAQYGAVAADWESGAIAWTAAHNGIRCLILRGVSDLVSPEAGEAYDGAGRVYAQNVAPILTSLVEHLPEWIAAGTPIRTR